MAQLFLLAEVIIGLTFPFPQLIRAYIEAYITVPQLQKKMVSPLLQCFCSD